MNWLTGPVRGLLTMIVATTLLGSTRAVAQLWASAAIGPTRPYEWAVVGSAGFRHSRVLVRARYVITFENPGARVDDVGILVGVVVTPASQRSQVSLGAGAGRVKQVYNCFLCSSPEFPTTNGLLLDAEARHVLARGFGWTGYAFADLNTRLSFGGLALGLFIGGL